MICLRCLVNKSHMWVTMMMIIIMMKRPYNKFRFICSSKPCKCVILSNVFLCCHRSVQVFSTWCPHCAPNVRLRLKSLASRCVRLFFTYLMRQSQHRSHLCGKLCCMLSLLFRFVCTYSSDYLYSEVGLFQHL